MEEQNHRKVSAFRCCLCPNPEKPAIENLADWKLLRCQNCKLMSYCGPEHQKDHWPLHKQFCRGITSIRKDMKVEHVMDINGSVTQLTASELREVKFMIQTIMVMKLHRELTEIERELIWFPRICNLCNSHDGALVPCLDCFAVGYCCEEHRVEDAFNHLKVCAELRLCYDFSLGKIEFSTFFQQQHNISLHILEELPEDDVKHIPASAIDVHFPKDLFEMHKLSTAFLYKGDFQLSHLETLFNQHR